MVSFAKGASGTRHEIAGEIEDVGSNIRDWKKGDRVFVSHHVPCNMCRYLPGRPSFGL